MLAMPFGRKNDNNNDKIFLHRKLLSVLGTSIAKERFEKIYVNQNQVMNRCESNLYSVAVSKLRKNGISVTRMNNICMVIF